MKEYIGLDSNIDYMTETDLKNRYGFTKDFLRMYFPKPIVLKCVDPAKRDLIVWKTRDVEHVLLDKNLQKAYESINVAEDFETKSVREYLKSYDLNELSQTASNRNRYFILHVGPTNRGKTYNALQALKRANKLISSPFDTNDSELLSYWLNCCRATLLPNISCKTPSGVL